MMFDPSKTPRIFGLAPGVDFPRALIDGLENRLNTAEPEDWARIELIVNTRRMNRRLMDLFAFGPARLLPRISLLGDLADTFQIPDILPAVPALRRRLELVQLIAKLLDQQPDLAARASLYDLADSFAALLEEMHGEGVSAQKICGLDVQDMSGHWARAQSFFEIAEHISNHGDTPDIQERQRLAVEKLISRWQKTPPHHPVILAGSTGSRGTTLMLMKAISRLPQGAVILPGFDFEQPDAVWSHLSGQSGSEDHPQYRFTNLMRDLEINRSKIVSWTETPPPCLARNKVISLALRPAPVTDAWMKEGPDLGDLRQSCRDITTIEAPSPRSEALCIALGLRYAAENGQTAALITPDRMLTRQVTAALDRWDILPDDSAGTPLQLSPPGRFLRLVAGLATRRLTGEMLLSLLKHPLCHAGTGRGDHLNQTRNLELRLRRNGPPFPDVASIQAHATRDGAPPAWIAWVCDVLCGQHILIEKPLSNWVTSLHDLAERLSAGSIDTGSGALWDKKAGQEAKAVMTDLANESEHGGQMTARDFGDLLGALLADQEVRDRDAPHSGIMIWGTLEARVQGADLVILGGLNEGSWPEPAQPDPWLNRQMRAEAGLLLPERRIGLSAHDFQQAMGAPKVWVTRSVRSDDSETISSRWLSRITSLLDGLPKQNGKLALQKMRSKGERWLNWAEQIDATTPSTPAFRPSPRPPIAARPRKLSVTEIKRLIRDPYAIYAKHVLRLRPLDPLVQKPDALLRGIAIHEILEALVETSLKDPSVLSSAGFMALSREKLLQHVAWPTARTLWLARLERITGAFLESEINRRVFSTPFAFEAKGESHLKGLDFTLTARADRIDRDEYGCLIMIDYKSGKPPTPSQQSSFDKQLLLMAAMAEQGGFTDIKPAEVASALFVSLGGSFGEVHAPLEEEPPAKIWADLATLIGAYFNPSQGYSARRMLHKDTDIGDYDHLSRFGEWDRTSASTPEDLT